MVWINIVIALVMAVVGELLRPKPKINNPEPSALGDFSFPTVDPSRVIPIFWGTCKMEGPNCTWFGDLEVVTLKKKVKTGWFSSKRVTTGFNYYLGVQLVYAYGELDEFLELRADDKVLDISNRAFAGDVCEFTIDSPNILSNDDPPAGVKGQARLYKGTFNQPTNLYLSEQWGEPEMSAFRPLVHLVLEKCYLGNTETPPPIALIGRRCPNQLGLTNGRHNVNGDSNIACAAYEVMTNMLFGMKIPSNKIDIDSFRECGNTLAVEGLGISMLIQNSMSGRDLLAEMLRHADAVVYADPLTGLYTMALARDDYLDHLDELLVLDDSNIIADTFEFTRVSWEMTKNTIVVNYTERSTFVVEPVQYQDLANIDVRQGVVDSEDINFLGFSNANAALNAAARACKSRSSPLMRAQFNTNRIGYQLRPGSVVKLRKPDSGIEEVIVRVIEISYGTLDDMAIKLVVMEDIFAVGHIAYLPPTPSDWQPPVGPPTSFTRHAAFEIPYEFTGNDGVYVGTLVSSEKRAELGYVVYSGSAPGDANLTAKGLVRDFTASGVLAAAYPNSTPGRDPVGFQVDSGRHMNEVESVSEDDLLGGDSIALIISSAGRELVAFKTSTSLGSDSFAISDVIRGVYGTTALSHPAGAMVWFLSSGFGVENESPRSPGSTVYLKYPAKILFATQALSAATQISLPLTGIAAKPYAPRYVRVNDAVDPPSVTGDAVLTWEFVNPEIRGGRISVAGSGSDPVTPGTTFTVRVFIGAALVRTVTGLNSPSFTYTAAMRLADSSNAGASVRLGVSAVRNAIASAEAQTEAFIMADAGWTPAMLTLTPDVWVNERSAVVEVSGALSQVADLSGNENSLSQGTTSQRPIRVPAVLNGRPVFRFDGSNDLLSGPSGATELLSGEAEAWVMAVYKSSTTNSTNRYVFEIGFTSGSAHFLCAASSLNGGTFVNTPGVGGRSQVADGYSEHRSATAVGTDWVMALHRVKFSTAQALTNVNGGSTETGTMASMTAANAAAVTTRVFNFGGNGGSGNYFGGDVAELLFGAGTLTQSDIDKLFGYLAWRWGLVDSLPTGHPYKSEPPSV